MLRRIQNRLASWVHPRKGFSIICAFNDERKLHTYLIPSLQAQDVPFELLTIDNRQGTHSCGAAILNETAKKAHYDYLMFVHQDVALRTPAWLSEAQKILRTLPDFGAVGVAGQSATGLVASVYNGCPPRPIGKGKIDHPEPVQTLDGCLMITPRTLFRRVRFDADTCGGWYLYVANYCLDAARLGHGIYVLPQDVYHESLGPANREVYQKTREAIIAKHRDRLPVIYTTVGKWKT